MSNRRVCDACNKIMPTELGYRLLRRWKILDLGYIKSRKMDLCDECYNRIFEAFRAKKDTKGE